MSISKQRIIWAAAFLLLLGTEVFIALFVRDDFIRPYLGDVLAVITVYCGGRVIFPQRMKWLSAAVMALALCVELIQLTDLAALFGEGSFMAVLLGATFDVHDLLCYGAGGIVCIICDIILFRRRKENDKL